MNLRLMLGAALALSAAPAAAAPALYNCEFDVLSDSKAGPQLQKKPLVREYIYDPAAGGGVVIGGDQEVLVVKGADAISFVTKGNDGAVDSTTISRKGEKDNRLPAVFSSHHIGDALEPKQWYGFCRLSQRG